MDWLAIGLGTLVIITVVVYITWPWRMQHHDFQTDLTSDSGVSAERLSKRREALLIALRDLDFDYTVGKVTDEDYGPMRQTLLADVAGVMTQLDEVQVLAENELEVRFEAETLAARRMLKTEQSPHLSQIGKPCLTCGRVSRAGDLYCRGCGTKLNTACPDCGETVHPTDHFCTSCGIELALALSG